KLSPVLRSHMTENEDDITRLEIKLDRMVIYFAGANSPAALAQKPIRFLFLDETDKYPRFSGREADPIKLASERTRTFWNRKIVKCSTPTTRGGYIFREYERTDKCRYFMPCPHCGHYQAFVFAQLRWPEEERDPEIIKDKKLAWYECAGCKGKIKDVDKHKMTLEGLWTPERCRIDSNGKIKGEIPQTAKRGFWINALYSPWISFSEIAAEFLRSRESIELLMNFVNSWLAEIWEEKTEETKEDKILEKQGDYPEGLVPHGAVVLTAGVDVQKDHFYIVIRGWGVGEESWLIRAARVEAWDDVIAVLFKTEYKRASGDPFKARLSCIDSGFRTDEVYELCRRWRDVARAIKGENHLSGVPYRPTRIDRNPKTGAAIEGGLSLWRLDTSLYKDKITRMVNSSPGDPSQWHVFKNISEEYVRQFCAEHKILVRDKKSGKTWEEWKKKSAGAPNHYWDAEVYAAAAADMLRVSSLREEGQSIPYIPKQTDDDSKLGGWVGNRKGWINR
ncbi:MAG: phage terminase large subunit family protein, partial [Parcubacteria group bacterium]|nr:phage terminase large subunit family protein [Parcubacteria group bacterium]